jgi:predicted ferric reductase
MTVTAPPAVQRLQRATQPRLWWADVATAAAVMSIVVVVSLWVADGGLHALTSGGGGVAVTSAGRLAGLLAADLLLLQVLAMARIPWVERSYGFDRLARWHRWVGFTSFSLLVTHVVLVTMGYALTARVGVPAELWLLVWSYPGMLLATAAAALITMVAVLSVKAARRRLRYESWHLLHLYAYLGVGLALPHQLWSGADFIASPAARLYWWTLYLATLAAVLAFRVGLPVWRTVRHRIVVGAVVSEAPGVVSVHLRGRYLDRLPVRAGQFFLWRFLDGEGWSRAHPYSLSAPPHPNVLRITVKDLGDGSHAVSSLRPGTRAVIEGPYGRLTADLQTRRRVTLLACGIGITPLRALLEDLTYEAGDATLIYRATSGADLALRVELDTLAERRGATVVCLTGHRAVRADGSPSWLPAALGHLSDDAALQWVVPDLAGHDVFICGPDQWADAARAAVARVGVPRQHIHEERFAW